MQEGCGKIAIFIDGENLFAATKALGFHVDYRQLLQEFECRGRLVRALYYTVIAEDQQYVARRPLIDWLDYNGFTVITKPAKEFTDSSGRRRIKGSTDVELTIDALELASHIDQMVLFSGDANFRSLLAAVQRRGVQVTVVSTIACQLISDELRRQADSFIDLAELRTRIARG